MDRRFDSLARTNSTVETVTSGISIKDFNFKGNITTLNPFVGYFIKDNECIGIKLGYSHLSANLDNLDIDIDDDMQFNLGDIRYLGETFSAALFHRAYIGIDKNKRFGFFNERN